MMYDHRSLLARVTTIRADAAAHPAGPPQPQDGVTGPVLPVVTTPRLVDQQGRVELDERSEWR